VVHSVGGQDAAAVAVHTVRPVATAFLRVEAIVLFESENGPNMIW
jgi:hypothetical protein